VTAVQEAPVQKAGAPPRQGRRRRVPPLVWAFLLLPLAVELFWVFWPAMNSFSLSFTAWNGVGAARPVGFENYERLFADPIFVTALQNNVIWAIGFGGLSVAGGLALAVALNRPGRGVGIYRSAIYLPMR
jgi:multiple sugar transport system permease protein